MGFLKNIASGYLGAKANQKLSGIKNPHARRIAGNLLGNAFGEYIPGLSNPPRNPDQNLLFGARMLSELQMRQELSEQSDQFGQLTDESAQQPLQKNYDWRARLRPKRGGENYVYGTMYADQSEIGGTNILQPIIDSGGLVWQYTPQIFVSAGANYQPHELQGTNYPINSYLYSRPPELPIASEFTANNIDEARYLLAVMTFLKVTTKSFAGESAVAQGVAGTPPPVLLFEYLGEHGFNKVPVIIKDYSIQYGEDIDYVPVHYQMGGEDTVTYVPTAALISINLSVNYTPQKLRKRYDITSLTTGQGYMDGFI